VIQSKNDSKLEFGISDTELNFRLQVWLTWLNSPRRLFVKKPVKQRYRWTHDPSSWPERANLISAQCQSCLCLVEMKSGKFDIGLISFLQAASGMSRSGDRTNQGCGLILRVFFSGNCILRSYCRVSLFSVTCQDRKRPSLLIFYDTEDYCIRPLRAVANLLATRACIKSCITCIYGFHIELGRHSLNPLFSHLDSPFLWTKGVRCDISPICWCWCLCWRWQRPNFLPDRARKGPK